MARDSTLLWRPCHLIGPPRQRKDQSMCNRTDVRNGPALLLWLCLCDDSFLGREVVGFIHGQLFRCSRVVAPDLWSSRPDVSSRDDPLARRSRRAFFCVRSGWTPAILNRSCIWKQESLRPVCSERRL